MKRCYLMKSNDAKKGKDPNLNEITKTSLNEELIVMNFNFWGSSIS